MNEFEQDFVGLSFLKSDRIQSDIMWIRDEAQTTDNVVASNDLSWDARDALTIAAEIKQTQIACAQNRNEPISKFQVWLGEWFFLTFKR